MRVLMLTSVLLALMATVALAGRGVDGEARLNSPTSSSSGMDPGMHGQRSFFAVRGRRDDDRKRSMANHLLRGRRNPVNHLLRGRRASPVDAENSLLIDQLIKRDRDVWALLLAQLIINDNYVINEKEADNYEENAKGFKRQDRQFDMY